MKYRHCHNCSFYGEKCEVLSQCEKLLELVIPSDSLASAIAQQSRMLAEGCCAYDSKEPVKPSKQGIVGAGTANAPAMNSMERHRKLVDTLSATLEMLADYRREAPDDTMSIIRLHYDIVNLAPHLLDELKLCMSALEVASADAKRSPRDYYDLVELTKRLDAMHKSPAEAV